MLVLVPGGPNVRTGTRLAAMFQAVEPQAGLTLMHEGRPAMTIAVYLGRLLVSAAPHEPRDRPGQAEAAPDARAFRPPTMSSRIGA